MKIKLKKGYLSLFFLTILSLSTLFLNTGCIPVEENKKCHELRAAGMLTQGEACSDDEYETASEDDDDYETASEDDDVPDKGATAGNGTPLTAGGFAHKNCLVKCPAGTPLDNFVVDHDVIVLSSNRDTKLAQWVAYKVKVTDLSGPSLPRRYAKDPSISAQYTLKPEDYKGLNQAPYRFDRGHLATRSELKGHPNARALDFLTNIAPQKTDLNQGDWKLIEARETRAVQRLGEIYVITGTHHDPQKVFLLPLRRVPNKGAPSGFFKVIALPDEGKGIRTVAFRVPQDAAKTGNPCGYLTTVREIERITGLTFFDGRPTIEDPELRRSVGCGTVPTPPRPVAPLKRG